MLYSSFQHPIQEVLSKFEIVTSVRLLDPPAPDLADFCIVVNSLGAKEDPKHVANKVHNDLQRIEGIDSVEIFDTSKKGKKRGVIYLNFKLEQSKKQLILAEFIENTLTKVNDKTYGFLEDKKGKNAIVEHTSANPISPLHVGNLRNSVQGDTFARILERYGYTVRRHFYVNDVGLQVSYVVIGYEILKNADETAPIKFDLWLGQVYAIMHNFYTIEMIKSSNQDLNLSDDPILITDLDVRLIVEKFEKMVSNVKDRIIALESLEKLDRKQKINLRNLKKELSTLQNEQQNTKKVLLTGNSLFSRFNKMFEILHTGLKRINLHRKTRQYLADYEHHANDSITNLFKEVVDWVLNCFSWTLNRYNIAFDQFDFESDVTKDGIHLKIIKTLANKENAKQKEKAIRLAFPQNLLKSFSQKTGIDNKSFPIRGDIPELQLQRSDGTTLYAAKDIAYSIQKYETQNPEVIFNVISSEQVLPQFQMLLAIFNFGHIELAKALKHYKYEIVELRGRPMSGRLAQYVTADEYYDETFIRARMAKRKADEMREASLPENAEAWELENQSLRAVTLASTRFPLIESAPSKKIELDLDRELDFKRNSGPFIQYAHARTIGVIRKISETKGIQPQTKIKFQLLATDEIAKLNIHLANLDEKIRSSVHRQDPSIIADWVFTLAQYFMKFYENYPVLKAETKDLLIARLSMMNMIRIGLATGLEILGIPPANSL